MNGLNMLRAGAAAALLGTASLAAAATINFTGSVTGISTLIGPDAHCSNPAEPFHALILPGNTSGTSNLGNFTYSTDTCLAPASANAPSSGTFTIDFGVDSFSGTFDGGSTFSTTPGISDTAWTFTILSGTGRFLDASGTFQGAGLADARTRPTHVVIGFIGDINAPAVPEPASWALMLLGFGGMGIVLRRRREEVLAQLA